MTTQELMERYTSLYDLMSASKNPAYMKTFGNVMNDMMAWVIHNQPELARGWISKLDSIRWKNYLTSNEAEEIVSEMEPVAPWTHDVWKRAMESIGLPMEDDPCYNSFALWTEMNKVYSDSSESIAKIMGVPLSNVNTDAMVKATYSLAVDNLKDEDGHYSIRRYFSI